MTRLPVGLGVGAQIDVIDAQSQISPDSVSGLSERRTDDSVVILLPYSNLPCILAMLRHWLTERGSFVIVSPVARPMYAFLANFIRDPLHPPRCEGSLNTIAFFMLCHCPS